MALSPPYMAPLRGSKPPLDGSKGVEGTRLGRGGLTPLEPFVLLEPFNGSKDDPLKAVPDYSKVAVLGSWYKFVNL